MSTPDVLDWRSTQTETYLELEEVARNILVMSATSAPAESNFSTMALTDSSKQTSWAQ